MKKRLGIIAFTLFGIICILLLLKIFIYFFWEPDTSGSKYDETFVYMNQNVMLNTLDWKEIQSEVLRRTSHEWKKVDSLDHITIYLDSELQLTRIVFTYQLNDIDEYAGELVVICDRSEEHWKILSVDSYYYYGLTSVDNQATEDKLFTEKVDAIIRYIKQKDNPSRDIYQIQLFGEDAYIDAYNVQKGDTQNNWSQSCALSENEEEFLYEEAEE